MTREIDWTPALETLFFSSEERREKRREEALAVNIEILEAEGWKPHPRFKHHVAHPDGTVMHAVSRVINMGVMKDGYNMVQPTIDKKQQNIMRQAFVWECFYGLYERSVYQVDHINNIRDDNRLENLQRLTLKEHGEKTKMTVSKTRAISNQRHVMCVETGVKYTSINQAAAHISANDIINAAKGIQKALTGYRKSYLSLTWKYDQSEDLGGETWKVISSDEIFDSIQISNLGRIKLKTGKITEGSLLGETRVNITNSKKKHQIFTIHYLVCRAFHGDPPGTWDQNRISVNHKNKFHDDNREENLEWSTPTLQAKHRFDIPVKNQIVDM